SGIKTMDDWFNSRKPVKIGGSAPGSTTDDPIRLVTAALGLPVQVVSGYAGTSKIRLAAESGEVSGGCWAWQSIEPTWTNELKSGEVYPVLQLTLESHPELKTVPLAINYAKTDEARALLRVAANAYSVARNYSV